MGSTALERWLQAWGVVTVLISAGFQELNVPDKEAVAHSNCPETSGKSMERIFTVPGVGSKQANG